MVVSAQTTRVPVVDGHTESVSIAFDAKPSADDVVAALRSFRGRPQELKLPTAPPNPIVWTQEANRPQPRLDVDRDGGMTVTVVASGKTLCRLSLIAPGTTRITECWRGRAECRTVPRRSLFRY